MQDQVGWQLRAAWSPRLALRRRRLRQRQPASRAAAAAAVAAAVGQDADIYSSLPLQGASRGQTEAVINGAKLALDAGRRQGRQVHDQVRLARRLHRAGRQVDADEADRAERPQGAQDKRRSSTSASSTPARTKVSMPILNKAGIPQI